jgi:hypothetical protein
VKGLTAFCEGETERNFCDQVLRPHLFPEHDRAIYTIEIEHSRHHGKVTRGGVSARYATMRRGILKELRGHKGRDMIFTSLIDLYGLPKDFPGKKRRRRNPRDPIAYIAALETAFGDDIGDPRFVPHLQLHEYETILFAEPESFRISFDNCDRAIEELKKIAASFPTVEHIDDGPLTSPSKRIIDLIPAYRGRKTLAGPDIAEYTGLPVIRSKCPHFDAWLTRLESLLRS